jgi:hypothetical protein
MDSARYYYVLVLYQEARYSLANLSDVPHMPRLSVLLIFALLPEVVFAQATSPARECVEGCMSLSQIVPGGAVEQAKFICKADECNGQAYLLLGGERIAVKVTAKIKHEVVHIDIRSEDLAIIPSPGLEIEMPLYSLTDETADFRVVAMPLSWLKESYAPVVRRPMRVPGFLRIHYETSTP